MYPYKALLTLGTLAMTLGISSTATASSDIALSFELPPSDPVEAEAGAIAEPAVAPPAATPPPQTLVNAESPLPIPPGAESPPMAGDNARPAGVYGGLDAITIGTAPSVQALLPAPPPVPDYVQPLPAIAPPPAEPEPAEVASPKQTEQLSDQEIQDQVEFGLAFQERTFEPLPDEAEPASTESSQPLATAAFNYSWDNFETLFAGGTDSLVAWAVGSAEGTRTPNGHKNPAYYGHVDPGNGVWNLGTFSYQHGAKTPEEADSKQLRRLQSQTQQLRQKAQAKGLKLSKEELLNGIDLANQAPLAALDRGGYLDWLHEAHNLGMQGQEAIVWARTRSFIDPDTQRWNAPGLGNNVYSISHDQERRANAIARAIASFTAQTQIAVAPAPSPSIPEESGVAPPAAKPQPQPQETVAFGLQLPSSVQPSDHTESIAAEDETEESTSVARATIEADEQAVALADPGTGLLLFTDPAPAKEPDKGIASTEPKPERPVFSRINRTLTRMLQGGKHEPAARGQDPAIAAEDSAALEGEVKPTSNPAANAEVVTEAMSTANESEQMPPSAISQTSFSLSTSSMSTLESAQTEPVTSVETETQLSTADSPLETKYAAESQAPTTNELSASQSEESISAVVAATVTLQESSMPDESSDTQDSTVVSVSTADPEPTAANEAAQFATEQVSAGDPEPAIAVTESEVSDPSLGIRDEPTVPKQTKAPALRTDAFDLDQTLDSLNQFQRQLRQELGT